VQRLVLCQGREYHASAASGAKSRFVPGMLLFFGAFAASSFAFLATISP
jgi:hypothetical protein